MSNQIETDMPLHEVVLHIMFTKNTEKAAAITPEDILWKINNPEISERNIREVLEWLVLHKRVEKYLGKYSLDRIEFLGLKERYTNHKSKKKKPDIKKEKTVSSLPPLTYHINQPKKPKIGITFYLLIGVFMLLAYTTYTLLSFQKTTSQQRNTEVKEATLENLSAPKKLYVSDSEEYDHEARKAIYYSFGRQNTINKNHTNQINSLTGVIDSLYTVQKNEITLLKQTIINNTQNTNAYIERNVYTYILIILFLGGLLFLTKKRF